MAANVETMFYVREKLWYGWETQVKQPQTSVSHSLASYQAHIKRFFSILHFSNIHIFRQTPKFRRFYLVKLFSYPSLHYLCAVKVSFRKHIISKITL